MLNMPPTDMSTYKGSAFFYKDPAMTFEKVLFLGKEFSMLLMDLLVFDLLDIAVGNSLVSALTTYLFSKLIEYVRFELGERNISNKTLVDRRFII
jgi:meckelin